MTFPSAEMYPEINKLNGLNPFLALEGLPQSDKLLLIYEKILHELNESFDKHVLMQDLDARMSEGEALIINCKSLQPFDKPLYIANELIKAAAQESRQLEKEVNK